MPSGVSVVERPKNVPLMKSLVTPEFHLPGKMAEWMWLEDGIQRGPLTADALIRQIQRQAHLPNELTSLIGNASMD